MLNQPINVIPSVLSGVGEGVVDATLPLTVSWQVSGDTPMLAYEIVIQKNDTDSTEMLDTGKVTLANPFYGNDRSGNVQTFSATEITAAQLSTAGIINGYENGYKIIITQWWGSTNDESIAQTSPSYFITRETPSLSISIPSPYTTSNPYNMKDITINASFSQADGDTVKTIRWYLYEGQTADQSNLLLDTGDMETQVLQLYYDGLFPSTYYYVEASVQTSSGVTVNTSATIYVNYSIGQQTGEVDVCKPIGKDYVEVSWNARSSIEGILYGDIEYERGRIHIIETSRIEYNPLSISTPWSIVWRGSANVYFNQCDPFVLSDGDKESELYIDTDVVRFAVDGNIIFSEEITVHRSDVFTVIITPTHYTIRQDTFTGGTIPSDWIYPSTNLYPSNATNVTRYYSGDITYTQHEIKSIKLWGDQYCDYLWIESGTLTQTQISQITGDEYYEPFADYNTMFLSSFNTDTTTAYISGNGGSGIGSAVYRKENGRSILEHVVDTDGGVISIRDYGARSRTQYQYYVFAIGTSIYTEAYGSGTITPQYNNYTLMECIYNENDGAYHVQASYPFACNASQGSISNNNTPNILQNFTRYPNRQPVNMLYASGTLTALIGSVNQTNATYTDSWELADDIIALSVSQNPKFLRDMKGKIWKVETSEAITTEVSTGNVFLPIKVTIPWVEVGSADGLSIVAVPSDPVYLYDTINQTSIDVDISSGKLVWTTPDNYSGTSLSLSGSRLPADTPADVYKSEIKINDKEYLIVNQ